MRPRPRLAVIRERTGAVGRLDRSQALDAFRALTALDVDVALVGHGEPLSGEGLRHAVPGPFAG